MKKNLILGALFFATFTNSCTDESRDSSITNEITNHTEKYDASSFARNATENDDRTFISGTKILSKNLKDMLFYVTENARSNSFEDLNSALSDYVTKINPAALEDSNDIVYITDAKQLSTASGLSETIQNMLNNNESYESTISSLTSYITEIENSETLDRKEYIDAYLTLSIVEYINENENNRFGFYQNDLVAKKNPKRCAASVLGGMVAGAAAGCWGGGKVGIWFGLQGAAGGCAVGAAFGAAVGALGGWSSADSCH
ncbi:hypothetical protein [uncultured Chryseobacterium sp.]|jgi:hypothetical protein|uniref:hypothetical protein n=1 Tax=uncultured Chryseobacterium sp. TaxID=259322 RepID=UPI0026212E62|nr:hypothetical protein [uncultured Chryseobacterium sp.]